MNLNKFFRFMIIGFFLNSIGLLTYSILSYFINPFLVVSILYPFTTLLGFFIHKRITFRSNNLYENKNCFFKYISVLLFGFLLNLFMLYILYNILNLNHIISQIFSIIIVAIFLFFLNKNFVFPNNINNISPTKY
jgi:putative flippase GtrA